MPKINVLDKHVSELIAAGEVVERPASAAKELLENTIDSGATAVTIEIKHGGVTFMRVTDNGCGITREDVPRAFLRHATSKVCSQDDLAKISTLGFRGEALASIAAVSHVELLTRTHDELAGTHYVIAGGEEIACDDAGCAEGTTFVMRDIFYNTPARMKFLKKDVTEGNAVAGITDHEALAHPEISFRFLRDGREALHTPGDGKLKDAIFAVYGREFTQTLLPVHYELNGVKVWGFISKPVASRANRSMQNFFLNGRYVKSRTAMVALEEAYKGCLMVGKFPACVLHIKVDFASVDVNVHPNKMEVRFMNEKPVFEAVYHAVKTALQQEDAPSLLKLKEAQSMRKPASFHAPAAMPEQIMLQKTPAAVHDSAAFEQNAVFNNSKIPVKQNTFQNEIPNSESKKSPLKNNECKAENFTENSPQAPAPNSASQVSDTEFSAPYAQQNEADASLKLVGEAFDTYIIVEQGNEELRFIDKHAAHERMLYEKLRAQSGNIPQQMLLSPVTVTLSKDEYSAVLQSLDLLAQAGYAVEDFGDGTVLVRGVPVMLQENIEGAVEEIAGYLAENRTSLMTEKLDWLYHNIACRAAVKAGDISTQMELAQLVIRMEKEDIRYCPHGRPVSIVLRRKDLEHQFGRI